MIPIPAPDEKDLFLFYGHRFTKDCIKFYILWFLLSFFFDVPHLGWWWAGIIIFGSALLGYYLVAAPYIFLVLKVVGGVVFWVVEDFLKLESASLASVRRVLHTIFYIGAVVYQFLLVRLSLDVLYAWVN